MYPPGIRVVKVSDDGPIVRIPIGSTGTVVLPILNLAAGCDIAVLCDQKKSPSAGGIWSCKSKHWRPINPDEGLEEVVEDRELVEQL